MLRLPSARKQVEEGMAQTRAEVDSKFVPSGPGVTRHLELPAHGQSAEWIMAEMDKMAAKNFEN